MAAGEAELLVLLLASGDVDGLETTALVASDVTDDCDGRVTRCGEEVGVVVAVEGGDFSTECDFRTSLLARTGSGPPTLMALFGGEAVLVVALNFPATVSGLEIGPLPDFRRTRRRSVDEGRFSVGSSCCERFRLDFRMAVLSRSLFTGLNPARSLPSSGFLAPDFIVDVRIRGEAVAAARGESQLGCCCCCSCPP